jgi:hypothetical protein
MVEAVADEASKGSMVRHGIRIKVPMADDGKSIRERRQAKREARWNKFISTPSQSGSNGDGNDYIFDPSQVTGAPAQIDPTQSQSSSSSVVSPNAQLSTQDPTMYNDQGEYWKTGYNKLSLESLRGLYPNMFGKDGVINPNEEEGLKLIRQGRIIPFR